MMDSSEHEANVFGVWYIMLSDEKTRATYVNKQCVLTTIQEKRKRQVFEARSIEACEQTAVRQEVKHVVKQFMEQK